MLIKKSQIAFIFMILLLAIFSYRFNNKFSISKRTYKLIVLIIFGVILHAGIIFWKIQYMYTLISMFSFFILPLAKYSYLNIFPLDLIVFIFILSIQWMIIFLGYLFLSRYFNNRVFIICLILGTSFFLTLPSLEGIAPGIDLNKEKYLYQNVMHDVNIVSTSVCEFQQPVQVIMKNQIVTVTSHLFAHSLKTYVTREGDDYSVRILPQIKSHIPGFECREMILQFELNDIGKHKVYIYEYDVLLGETEVSIT